MDNNLPLNNSKHGFILINKLSGPTSHTIVNQLRRITGIRKIGHAGTLDPFASGLLIVAISREATKKIDQFVKMDKEYVATLHLGAETDSYDRMGVIQENKKTRKQENNFFPLSKRGLGGFLSCWLQVSRVLGAVELWCKDALGLHRVNHNEPTIDKIEKVLKTFLGKQKQIPPMFSAKKVNGKKLYELAREGIEIERQPLEIEIYDIEMIKYEHPLLKIKVRCSTGTYIRSLAFDIGRKLSCGAYLEELERTAIGEFRVEKSVGLKELTGENWVENILSYRPEGDIASSL